jgi:hypothetical protein
MNFINAPSLFSILFFLLTSSSLFADQVSIREQNKLKNISDEVEKNINNLLEKERHYLRNLPSSTKNKLYEYIIKKKGKKESLFKLKYYLYDEIFKKTFSIKGSNNERKILGDISDIYIIKDVGNKKIGIVHANGLKLLDAYRKTGSLDKAIKEVSREEGGFEGADYSFRKYTKKQDNLFWLRGSTSGIDGIYISYQYSINNNKENINGKYRLVIKMNTKFITNIIDQYNEGDANVFIATSKCLILYHKFSSLNYKLTSNLDDESYKKILIQYPNTAISVINPPQKTLCAEMQGINEKNTSVETKKYKIRNKTRIAKLSVIDHFPNTMIVVSIPVDKALDIKYLVDILLDNITIVIFILVLFSLVLIAFIFLLFQPKLRPLFVKLAQKILSVFSSGSPR